MTRSLILGAVFCFTWASPAGAQSPAGDAADMSEAERAFVEGSNAASEARWADSEAAFRRAYELTGAATALFNVAVALRALGRHVEASQAFREVLVDEGLDEALRTRITEMAAESEARIARLELFGLDAAARYRVLLDVAEIEDEGSRPLALTCDEGTHVVRVSRDGFLPFEWRSQVAAGDRVRVDVTMSPLPSEGGGVLEEPLFWIGLAVLVAGGAALASYLIYDASQLSTDTPARFDL